MRLEQNVLFFINQHSEEQNLLFFLYNQLTSRKINGIIIIIIIRIVSGRKWAIRRKQIINANIALTVERNVNIISLSIISKSYEQRFIIRPIGVCSKKVNGNRNKFTRKLLNNLRDAFILIVNIIYVLMNSNRTIKLFFYGYYFKGIFHKEEIFLNLLPWEQPNIV